MFQTPILFLIFNRPDVTFKVFEQIKKIKPKYLYVAADGPRAGKANEEELCMATRAVVDKVDWDCELKTFFREENVGCARNVSSAISWFFEQEESGIILEDDCLPDVSFFHFCDTLLHRYQDHDRVMAISGYNVQLEIRRTSDTYFFAEIPLVWGWATWKKAWQQFQFNVPHIDDAVFDNAAKKPWKQDIENAFSGKTDSWAYRWIYAFLRNKYICIYPEHSLVNNIGVSDMATHTVGSRWWYKFVKYGKITTMKHPASVAINHQADMLNTNLHYNLPLSLSDKLKRKWYSFFR